MKKQTSFDDIVRGDFEIDAIVISQAERLCMRLKGLNAHLRCTLTELITGDIESARAFVLAWRSEQAGHQITL